MFVAIVVFAVGMAFFISGTPSVTVAQVPTPGLVAAYSFNEGSGGTALDSSGNSNTGVLSGISWTNQGRFGKALSFDGVNDWVTIADAPSLDLTTGMTVEAWVYPTTSSGVRDVLIKEGASVDIYNLYSRNGRGRAEINVYISGSNRTAEGSVLKANVWTHLAGTYDGSMLRLYINGIEAAHQAQEGLIAPSSGPLRIGGNSIWGEYFKGRIDEVRIYNRALTQAEIQNDMNTLIPPPPPPTPPPVAAFSATPTGGPAPLTVTFSDASTGSITSWAWTFGGGSTSTTQNPSHTYTAAGSYTVSLTVTGPGGSNTATKIDYITVTTSPGPPPVAGFSATPTSGPVPLTVTFIDASTGSITSWAWTFGDGSTSTTQNPSHTYTAAGSYTVSLTATGSDGSDTATKTGYISANPTGLVAAYGFNEGSGITVADASGKGNTGTISGATWTTLGRFGKALVFDGSNDWVTINDAPSLDLTTGMTLEAWVFPTAVSPTRDVLVKEGPGVDIYNLYASNSVGNPEINGRLGSANYTAEGQALAANTWTHLVGTYDGTTFRLYLNGVQVANRVQTGTIAASSGPVRIGGNSMWGEYFAGRIDEVRIYSRALTQAEIQNDMNTPITSPPPPPTASQVGLWSEPFDWPIVAVHMMLLQTGEVLAWEGHTDNQGVQLWDPTTNVFASKPYNAANLFCAGHSMLSDGRILVAGGHINADVGIRNATIFNPATENWAAAAPMAFPRWYPTVTTLPDGRVLVVSGSINCYSCIAEIPEIYNPTTNTWTQLSNAKLALPQYPHMFVLPDGRLLAASTQAEPIISSVLHINTQTWTPVGSVAIDGGSSAMYLPGKVIKSGTAMDPDFPIVSSVANTYVLDMTQPEPAWRQTAPMAFPRTQHNLTLLPDGSVLVIGGSKNSDVYDLTGPVYEAEIWSPQTETWTTMARMQVPRIYHSTALLLPDGRVLVAGGGQFGVDQFSAEIYSPPYLFKGDPPAITAVTPTSIQYGTTFSVQTPDASSIASVSLIRLGSVTHAFNMDQRFLELAFSRLSGSLNVQAPGSANLAPPGYYMLFIVDTSGVPSVASIVRYP